jgi:hypothetical protein
MKRFRFAYNEPRLGDIEVDGPEGISEEAVLRMIEEQYPEAIDVEILEFEELNG